MIEGMADTSIPIHIGWVGILLLECMHTHTRTYVFKRHTADTDTCKAFNT